MPIWGRQRRDILVRPSWVIHNKFWKHCGSEFPHQPKVTKLSHTWESIVDSTVSTCDQAPERSSSWFLVSYMQIQQVPRFCLPTNYSTHQRMQNQATPAIFQCQASCHDISSCGRIAFPQHPCSELIISWSFLQTHEAGSIKQVLNGSISGKTGIIKSLILP